MSKSKEMYMDLMEKKFGTYKPNLRFWTPAMIHEAEKEQQEIQQ